MKGSRIFPWSKFNSEDFVHKLAWNGMEEGIAEIFQVEMVYL